MVSLSQNMLSPAHYEDGIDDVKNEGNAVNNSEGNGSVHVCCWMFQACLYLRTGYLGKAKAWGQRRNTKDFRGFHRKAMEIWWIEDIYCSGLKKHTLPSPCVHRKGVVQPSSA